MYKTAIKRLEEYGIRPSPQRLAVMNFLINNKKHPKIDEIHAALAPFVPRLSRMTVYNTVTMLAEKGVIQALDLDSGGTRYDGYTDIHAHFVCTRCGRIIDIEAQFDLESIYKAGLLGDFTVMNAQLIYKGTCDKCNELLNNN